jgi:hypothetical protein
LPSLALSASASSSRCGAESRARINARTSSNADERAQQFVEMLVPHVGFGADVLTAGPSWDDQARR